MKVACIIQARVGSSRLPGKIIKKILGKEMIVHEIERVLNSKRIDAVVIATTSGKADDPVEKLVLSYDNPKVVLYRGSEEDVLDRYYGAAKVCSCDVIVRVTGDCPLIDWELIDAAIEEFTGGKYDYVSNVLPKRTYPRGLDVEVFGFKTLEWMWKNCKKQYEREHVTAYIRENPGKYRIKNLLSGKNLSDLRWTVDEGRDFMFVSAIYKELYPNKKNFNTKDILGLLKKKPELSGINKEVEQKKNLNNEAN